MWEHKRNAPYKEPQIPSIKRWQFANWVQSPSFTAKSSVLIGHSNYKMCLDQRVLATSKVVTGWWWMVGLEHLAYFPRNLRNVIIPIDSKIRMITGWWWMVAIWLIFPLILGCDYHPNWRTLIFFRGVAKNHQPTSQSKSWLVKMNFICNWAIVKMPSHGPEQLLGDEKPLHAMPVNVAKNYIIAHLYMECPELYIWLGGHRSLKNLRCLGFTSKWPCKMFGHQPRMFGRVLILLFTNSTIWV